MVTDKNLLKLRINLIIVVTDQKTWSYVNNTQYTTPYLIIETTLFIFSQNIYVIKSGENSYTYESKRVFVSSSFYRRY